MHDATEIYCRFETRFAFSHGFSHDKGAVGSDFKIDASYISPNVGIPGGKRMIRMITGDEKTRTWKGESPGNVGICGMMV